MRQVPDIHYSPGFNRLKISWLPAPHARQLPAIRLRIAVSRREPTSSDKAQKAPGDSGKPLDNKQVTLVLRNSFLTLLLAQQLAEQPREDVSSRYC
jgi:hypothetical protein